MILLFVTKILNNCSYKDKKYICYFDYINLSLAGVVKCKFLTFKCLKVKVFSHNMQLHSLHFQPTKREKDFFEESYFVFPKVVLRGPDKDDNYPDLYKAKQLSKMSESCLSLPTVDVPQRNPYLLGIEKQRRKMCLWACVVTR